MINTRLLSLMEPPARRRGLLALLSVELLLALLFSACSIRLVSDYDDVLDKNVTELQMKCEDFLIRMEMAAGSAKGTYSANTDFYRQTTVTLTSLTIRAEAAEHNELTARQLGQLSQNIEQMRTLHEGRGSKGLSKALIDPIRTAVDSQFKAILKFELAKKAGGKSN